MIAMIWLIMYHISVTSAASETKIRGDDCTDKTSTQGLLPALPATQPVHDKRPRALRTTTICLPVFHFPPWTIPAVSNHIYFPGNS